MRVGSCVLFLFALPIFVLAQTTGFSKLTGTVFDAEGSVVVGAKITAVAAEGKRFHATTNDEGMYELTLSYNRYDRTLKFRESKYDVIVDAVGFRRSETKGYVFIPSQFGKMTFDIALEVGSSHDINHP